MQTVSGIPASPGIFIGPALVFGEEDAAIPNYPISATDIDKEWRRFLEAQTKAQTELNGLRDRALREMGPDHAAIFDSHLLMVNDEYLLEEVETQLKSELKNIEWIIYCVEQSLVDKLKLSGDSNLAERSSDIKDVSRRIISHLLQRERRDLSSLKQEGVLVAHNLLPSETVSLDRRTVRGIALDSGGKTSHTAILARAFRIPAVLGLSGMSAWVKNGENIIIDGERGIVILDPDQETVREYLGRQKLRDNLELELSGYRGLPAETLDGHRVIIKANIEIPQEVEAALDLGAEGVGLYRSEFLFLNPGPEPSEEDQYQAYAQVARACGDRPVTIRSLDLGGDKMLPEMEASGEKNPLLGWRAIRFCLSSRDLFKRQLRAILRASSHGKLRLMFPMVSGSEELDDLHSVLEESKAELRAAGEGFDESMPVGIMIEIPSAAVTSDILAKRAAFFSIGTNDLIQYTIAVDRGNEKTAYLYQPFHPAVLRLIKLTIDNAHAAGIPVSMCGELAGDPYATVILLGLGLDEFSMSPVAIPATKKIIRSVSLSEATTLSASLMGMTSYREVERAAHEWLDARQSPRA